MRQAEVESLFLTGFQSLYPQFAFRGLRRFPGRGREPFSVALRLAFGRAETAVDLLCVMLTEGTPKNIERFLERLADIPPREEPDVLALPTLVAPYLGSEAQRLCREAGVGYFDLAGNAGLEAPGLYLDIAGRSSSAPRRREVLAPFEGKAERITRRLLLEPRTTWKMRELAQAAEVSLGLASMTTSALAAEGLVLKSRAGIQVPVPDRLLDAWAGAYDLRRSSMRILHSFEDISAVMLRLTRLSEVLGDQYALTLWTGAQQLLQDEEAPPHVALYWCGELEALLKAMHLTEDVGRSYVFAFTPYDPALLWGAGSSPERLRVVHPLQLYLDLGSGDRQELKLAQRVRQELLGEAAGSTS
jgi:hypothetical protein